MTSERSSPSSSSSSSSSSGSSSIRDDAVCIRRWDYSETSQTVSLFARDHGVLRGLAKGAKREHARFSGGIELLTRGEILAIVKASTDLATLTEWNLQEIFPVLSRSLHANRAALYFADLVHHMLTDLDPHPALYDGLLESLRVLNDGDAGDETHIASIVLSFQWLTLCECGYRPVLEHDAQSGEVFENESAESTYAFSPMAGGLVKDTGENSPNRWRVRTETIHLLRKLSEQQESSGLAGALSIAGSSAPQGTDRANRLLAAYIRTIIDKEPITMTQLLGPIPT